MVALPTDDPACLPALRSPTRSFCRASRNPRRKRILGGDARPADLWSARRTPAGVTPRPGDLQPGPSHGASASWACLQRAGVLAATSAPASAVAMACKYDGHSYNACLYIDYVGPKWWNVQVGLNRTMPRAYAALDTDDLAKTSGKAGQRACGAPPPGRGFVASPVGGTVITVAAPSCVGNRSAYRVTTDASATPSCTARYSTTRPGGRGGANAPHTGCGGGVG